MSKRVKIILLCILFVLVAIGSWKIDSAIYRGLTAPVYFFIGMTIARLRR